LLLFSGWVRGGEGEVFRGRGVGSLLCRSVIYFGIFVTDVRLPLAFALSSIFDAPKKLGKYVYIIKISQIALPIVIHVISSYFPIPIF